MSIVQKEEMFAKLTVQWLIEPREDSFYFHRFCRKIFISAPKSEKHSLKQYYEFYKNLLKSDCIFVDTI